MKYFIEYFSLSTLFAILILGLSVHFFEYEKQQVIHQVKYGKYTFDKNFSLSLNDTIIKRKMNQEYENVIIEKIMLNRSNHILINKKNKELILKNGSIDIKIKYKIQDSLVFKAVQINIANLKNCEN